MKKLSLEYITSVLDDRGFKFVGDYVNSTTSVEVECDSGHRYMTRVANIINRGDGCSVCSGHSSKSVYTISHVSETLSKRGIELLTPFTKTRDKSKFKCEHGHEWETTVQSVVSGGGCPTCWHNKRTWTKEEIEQELDLKGITMITGFIGGHKSTKFKCSFGHVWETTPKSLVRNGRGFCPMCVKSGFKRNKRAWLYVIKFNGFIKYGITNNLEQRLSTHARVNGQYELIYTKMYNSGEFASSVEKIVKTLFGGSFVDKTTCPDGFTETLSPDNQPMLIETLEKINEI